jgi:SNF2 family DNA or RNA helicase
MRHIVGLMKVHPTIELAQEFLENTEEKLVIFVHHLDVAEAMKLVITDWCLSNDLNEPLVFHAGLNSQQRYDIVEKFKLDKSRLMIASSLAAGEGINLQFCSNCIIAERQWNPANEEQIEGRFMRIGSTADRVDAQYVVVSGTIDEYFTELVEKKRSYMNATLDGKATNYSEESLMVELTKIMIEKNRKTVFKGW